MLAQPCHTGRHLVLMRKELGERGVLTLHRVAGLRVRVSSDHQGGGGAHPPPAAGEGFLFDRLGAALVQADPDQLASLHAHTRRELVAVEPERVLQLEAAAPLEPAIQPQGGIHLASPSATPDGARHTWALQTTGVTESRFSGRGIRVAILDTGLDLEHPDFSGRPIVSRSFVAGQSVHDANGHGTYCAGLACGPSCAAQPPRYGVAGDAEIYIGKVIDDDGRGVDGDILAAIDWSVRSGCAIISLSVGTPVPRGEPYSLVYEQVARRALEAGSVIMASAGNASLRPDSIAPVDHPANCPSILAVAAIDASMRIAPFSCGGINPDGGEIDLAAPGVAIRSAWPRPELYRTSSGTSMATPYVVGIAALLAEAHPSARGRALKDLLRRRAKPLPLPPRDVGVGLVQAP